MMKCRIGEINAYPAGIDGCLLRSRFVKITGTVKPKSYSTVYI